MSLFAIWQVIRASKLARSVVLAGGAVVLLLGAYWYVTNAAYNRGWGDALAEIAEQNRRATDLRRELDDDTDSCFNQNGDWNFETGTCDFPD